MQFQVTNIEGWSGAGGSTESERAPSGGDFWKFTKKMHFKISQNKIQPTSLKLIHYYFVAVQGNISIWGQHFDLEGDLSWLRLQ